MKVDTLNTQQMIKIGYHHGASPLNNVVSYMEEHVRKFPERTALRWVNYADRQAWNGEHSSAMPHQSISYQDFYQVIDSVAHGLQELGISRGDRVIIFLPMGVGMYGAMFAVQKLGAIAVFLDSWARSSHLGASAACAKPKAMVSHKAAFDLIASVPEFSQMPLRILAGPGMEDQLTGGKAPFSAQLEQLMQPQAGRSPMPTVAVASEDTALITFTTGSSGVPKGANRTHRFLSAQHWALSWVVPYTPADSDMPAFPIFSLNNLASGVVTILPALDLSRPSERDAAALVSQMLSEELTCTTLSPSMLNQVSAYCLSHKLLLTHLRRVVTGGAPISRDNVRDFAAVAPGAEIWVLYGSTEVEPMAHIEAQEMLHYGLPDDPEIAEEGVNVGHISEDLNFKFIKIVRSGIDLSVSPWDELILATGEVGEFIVSGEHVCRDYYNNPEAFTQTKILEGDGTVWHRTGDLARLDAQGFLWMVGRIHNAIERGGKYYFPVRAEVILQRLEFVQRSAFLGLPDSVLGERTAVVLELKAGNKVNLNYVKEEIQRLFGKNQIPVDSIYLVDHVPMDPRHHSKVEYSALKATILRSQPEDLLAPPAL